MENFETAVKPSVYDFGMFPKAPPKIMPGADTEPILDGAVEETVQNIFSSPGGCRPIFIIAGSGKK